MRDIVPHPYGEERWHISTLLTDYRFTGQRLDPYIKLTIMGARWYDAELGRWISPDTIIPDSKNPQSLNRYSYVYNSPSRYIDPTGHDIEEGEQYEEATQIIEELLKVYGIWIDGAPFYWDWGALGQVYLGGVWEIEDLRNIQAAVKDFAGAMDGPNVFKGQLRGTVIRRYTDRENWMGQAQTSGSSSYIGLSGSFLEDKYDPRFTIVHELAHALDQHSNGSLSIGLVAATGGSVQRVGFWIGDFPVFNSSRDIYEPGSRLPDKRAMNPPSHTEDWAYSAAYYLRGKLDPLTVDRQVYLATCFPGFSPEQ